MLALNVCNDIRPGEQHVATVTSLPRPLTRPASTVPTSISTRSRWGLNAANFFLAEMVGVVMPFLGKFLAGRGWGDGQIQLAATVAGLGVFLMQTPAGFLIDRVQRLSERGYLARLGAKKRAGRPRSDIRALLAAASMVVGVCIGLLPLLPADWVCVGTLLFAAGLAQAFLGPLLGALALGLAGRARLPRLMGTTQGWNHAGNIAAAAVALALVAWLPVSSVFYAVAVVSALAAGSVFAIRRDELHERPAAKDTPQQQIRLRDLFGDRRVLVLFAATALFHLANAPVMPLVGLYVTRLGGTGAQVACVVLVAQAVMVPVAALAGLGCQHWGRKPVFAIGFLALPIRIFLYSLTREPWVLVALQALDGIGAGIYGVAVVAVCADLAGGTGRFNVLQGAIATAQAAGGVLGPLAASFLVSRLSFAAAFDAFALVAALAAAVFVFLMPETRPSQVRCPT
jgi:MFS family permease